MGRNVDDNEKDRLYEEYGKPPEREDPIDVSRDNLVYACSHFGPMYKVVKGRVTNDDVSERKMEVDKGLDKPEGTRFVEVRYGPSMQESFVTPISKVLEKLGEEAEYEPGEGFREK